MDSAGAHIRIVLISDALARLYAQIPGFYAYQRGRKLGEVIGAYPAELQVRLYVKDFPVE
jgi:hypothetical protein